MEKFLITDEAILEYYGWSVDCESPYEISNIDGSSATGQAVSCVLNSIRQNYILEKYEELMESIHELSKQNSIIKEMSKRFEE